MKTQTFRVAHIGKSHVYCRCPLHEDTRPSVEITLEGDYEGRAYCFSCNRVWQLNKGDVEKLKKLTPKKAQTEKNFYNALPISTDPKATQKLADKWKVKHKIIQELGIKWKDGKYLIPMYDLQGFYDNRILQSPFNLCGIQCQCEDGFKFCMEGSQLGLFLPIVGAPPTNLFITEGCSDLAAVLDLGFPAIGRPNCNSCVDLLISFLELYPKGKYTVLADSDPAGMSGAIDLCNKWNEKHPNKMTYVCCPQGNDVREYVSLVGKVEAKRYLEGYNG